MSTLHTNPAMSSASLASLESSISVTDLKALERTKVDRTRTLLALCKKHSLSDNVVDDLMAWIHSNILPGSTFSDPSVMTPASDLSLTPATPTLKSSVAVISSTTTPTAIESLVLPKNTASARAFLESQKPQPAAAAFSHSLERNGANNVLLFLVREFCDDFAFTVISPKEGPMRADYEAMGVNVVICSMKSVTYGDDVRGILSGTDFKYTIANTIMTSEAVRGCDDLNIPCLWLIHEAWPHDQLDYYARDVFLMPPQVLDGTVIKAAFKAADRIVFPAHVQRKCYQSLFEPHRASVIYNGIPLDSINEFRATQNRDAVRASLGYGPDDFVLAQLGTVCQRKGQLTTCKAFAQLHESHPHMKLIMVGARYIRQHEIDYIEECKKAIADVGAQDKATILDVKKNVLPFYFAADVVLVPSFNEVLPLVICESMAFERPVIASKIDGIPEALDHLHEGMLMEPGNVEQLVEFVELLHDDPSLRKSMGSRGRKRVMSQFSFDNMSKTYRQEISKDLKMDLVKSSN